MDHMPFAGGAAGAGGITVWLIKTFVDRKQDRSLKKVLGRLDALESQTKDFVHQLETNKNDDQNLKEAVKDIKKALDNIQSMLMNKGIGAL